MHIRIQDESKKNKQTCNIPKAAWKGTILHTFKRVGEVNKNEENRSTTVTESIERDEKVTLVAFSPHYLHVCLCVCVVGSVCVCRCVIRSELEQTFWHDTISDILLNITNIVSYVCYDYSIHHLRSNAKFHVSSLRRLCCLLRLSVYPYT